MKIVKGGFWIMLPFLVILMLLSLYAPVARANGKDTEQTGSISWSTEGANYEEEWNQLKVGISIYQVAYRNQSGKIVVHKEFEPLCLEEFLESGETIYAGKWEQKAKDAKKIVEEKKLSPYKEGTLVEGELVLSSLEQGLYLVVIDNVSKGIYSYSCNPYFVQIPFLEENEDGEEVWSYDAEGSIKSERITKTETKEISDSDTGTKSSSGVQTSDDNHVILYTIGFCLSMLCIVALCVKKNLK